MLSDRHALSGQAVRYLIAGGLVFLIDLMIFIAVIAVLPMALVPANVAAKSGGALSGFLLHKYWTFSWDQRDGGTRQLATYIALFLFNMVLATVLLWAMVERAGVPELPAKIGSDVVVIIIAFVTSRTLIFRKS